VVFDQPDHEHTKRRQRMLGSNEADSANDAEFPFSPPRRISSFLPRDEIGTDDTREEREQSFTPPRRVDI